MRLFLALQIDLKVPSGHHVEVRVLSPAIPVNTILKEKWIKIQEGGRPKGPSDPKDHGRDKAHGRTFRLLREKRMLIFFHKQKKQRLKVLT